jgi:hypothetical protein
MAKDVQRKIEELLRDLTKWRVLSGIDPSTATDVRSTGESNAAIEDIRRKLDGLGARYSWSESAQEYRLDSIDATPDNEEEPNERNN